MNTLSTASRRTFAGTVLGLMLVANLFPGFASAQGTETRIELRPHCEGAPLTSNQCPQFEVQSPLSRQTPPLKGGDVLDMDLVVYNPSKVDVARVRAWLAYDPNILEGESIELTGPLTVPVPGESDFSATEGYAKINVSAQSPVNADTIVVARIRMKVKSNPINNVISFYDATSAPSAHTGVFVKNGTQEQNTLSGTVGFLLVRFGEAQASAPAQASSAAVSSQASSIAAATSVSSAVQAASSAQSVAQASSLSSTVISSAMTSDPVLPPPTTVFTLLQVQNLRITTEGSSIFLAWDALPSAELIGYNVYYGTTSGRYIQRRAVDKGANTLTIRALPEGTTYYVSVRGVNARGQETDFSNEVGISVGNPATSTSPLSMSLINNGPDGQAPGTGGNVAGETGTTSTLLLLIAASAVIGMVLAFRRQLHTATIRS